MRTETSGTNRRANFDKYYKAHPEKLGGRSLDAAYAAMQRESTRQNVSSGQRQGPAMNSAIAGRQAAIQRRIQNNATPKKQSTNNPATLENTIPGYSTIKRGISIPSFGGGHAKIKLPTRDTNKDQQRLDAFRAKMKRSFMPG